jgi:hypothetical protein
VTYAYWSKHGQVLPHPSTLKKYKNIIKQKPGFIQDMFLWMRNEAEQLGLETNDRAGAIILDEMSIQVRSFVH